MKKKISKYGFKEGFPFEFEIVSLRDVYLRHREMLINPHRTEFYHILWFQKGTPTHYVDFEPVKIYNNSLLFVNKDQVNSFDKSSKFDGYVILFTDDFYCQTEQDRKFLKSTPLFNYAFNTTSIKIEKSDLIISSISNLILDEIKKPADEKQKFIIKNYLHNLMLLAERKNQITTFQKKVTSSDLELVMLFKDILDEQYKVNKTVSNYAKLLKVYSKRLNIATSNVFGKTPNELIKERVILEAKRLIVYSDLSIKEIGYELGFEETTNFIKYFRKQTSLTPLAFKEKNQL